jgi:Zn-dependent protease
MNVRVFGFDVEITASFWFSAALLGLLQGGSDPGRMVLWVLVVLVSVLVHELGHALAFKWHRVPSSIRLHFMGGVTMPEVILPLSRLANIAIYLAGPFAGFVLAGASFAALRYAPVPGFVQEILVAFVLANLFWGVMNLVPVLPLDGGHVLEHALGPKRLKITLGVSAAVGLLVALWFLQRGSFWGAYIFGMSAAQSFFRLRDPVSEDPVAPTRVRRERDEVDPATVRALAEVRRAIDADDGELALRLALAVAEGEGGKRPSDTVRAEALHLAAWAALSLGRADEAERYVARLGRKEGVDAALAGNIRFAQGRDDEARSILQGALAEGDDRKEVFGPLIQLWLRAGEPARAAALAVDAAESISSEDLRTLARMVADEGAHHWAGRLLELVYGRDHVSDDGLEAVGAYARGGSGEQAIALVRKIVEAGHADAHAIYGDSELAALAPSLEAFVPRPS